MADFGKIDRNLKRLYQQNAPDDDVQAYLAAEGVTAEQVASWKDGQSSGGGVLGAIAGAPKAIYETVVGRQDPAYADVAKQPSIERASGIVDPQAEMFGVSDAAYSDIYKKNLGDRYLGSEIDKNGYEIIRFRDKDGAEKRAYVNRPGLDWQDVNRGISSALPYVAAATGLGRLTGAMGVTGTLANAGVQGLGAAVTSGLQDRAAQSLGSEQPLDTTRALTSGALGVGGELVGRAAMPLIRRYIGDRSIVGADGKLTNRGRRLVQKEGLDPSLVDDELAAEIRRRATFAKDPAEAITQSTTDQFGIPTTKGQRTKDPQLLLTEKDIRAGTLGDQAKRRLADLDEQQANAIRSAALGDEGRIVGQGAPDNAIAPRLAPDRSPVDFRPDVLGESIRGGARESAAKVKQLENQAWSLTENILPRAGAAQTMPSFVRKRLGPMRVNENTPTAMSMAKELDEFMKGGGSIDNVPEVLGQQSVQYIDELRRRLMAMKDGAATNADRAASKALYSAFDDWMVTSAQQGLLTGKPGAAQALLNARKTTAELRGLLAPRVQGKKTAAARVLERVQNADTGEEALRALLGSSGPQAALPDGAVQALRHYKAATTTLGGDVGKQAWNDVRLSQWLRLVTGKNGEMLSPNMVAKNISLAFQNRPSMLKVLYSDKEQALMRQYAQAVKAASYTDPNPSGSGTAIRGIFPNLVKEQLEIQSKRELFSQHNVLMSRIYRGLAKVVPNILEGKNTIGSLAAGRATSQRLTPRQPPSMAGYATGLSPLATDNNRTSQFSPNQDLARVLRQGR